MLALVLLIVSTNVKAGLLPYGPSVELREDFPYTVPLSQPFRFAGSTYNNVYISDNGLISLEPGFIGGEINDDTYDIPWIAPYGADIGAGSYGSLYYYEVSVTETATQQAVMEIIQSEYPAAMYLASNLILVATWQDVRAYPVAEDKPKNTFQAVIAADVSSTFVIFLYEQLEWGPAVVGISSGDPTKKRFICGSRTNVVTHLGVKSLSECSNSPGQFVFQVDDSWTPIDNSCVQIFTPRNCSVPAINTASRNRRCPAR